jgi:hypothetical protein
VTRAGAKSDRRPHEDQPDHDRYERNGQHRARHQLGINRLAFDQEDPIAMNTPNSTVTNGSRTTSERVRCQLMNAVSG